MEAHKVDEVKFCDYCGTGYNGRDEWKEHFKGAWHQKRLWEKVAPCSVCGIIYWRDEYEEHCASRPHRRQRRENRRRILGKGVVLPPGTALIIEQTALWQDAAQQYLLTLYARAALKARL